jgi:hypothetical protein
MSTAAPRATAPRPRTDAARIPLPRLHLRLTPALSERRDRVAAAIRRFPGGPPIRPA